jgi:hypothetical protein
MPVRLSSNPVNKVHVPVFVIWCWRRMEKISWTDHLKNEEILLTIKYQSNIIHGIRKRKAI